MSLSLLSFHPELPNLWLWELLFTEQLLLFTSTSAPVTSQSSVVLSPSAFFPKTQEVSFSVVWASHPFQFYLPFSAPSLTLLCPFWAVEISPAQSTQKGGTSKPLVLEKECPVPSYSPLSQAAWHPWNWGFKETAKAQRSLSWTVTVSYKFSPTLFWFGLFCHSLHHSFFSTFLARDTNCFTGSSWINQQNTELPERAQYFGGEDFTEVLHITHPLS